MKFKVTMICKEISRAIVEVEHDNNDHEVIKDKAWALFGGFMKPNLEQENYTKVERVEDK